MLDRLVSILPASQRDKAKAWVAWLGTVATIAALVTPQAPKWLVGAIAVLTALGVYGTPNQGYTSDRSPAHDTATGWVDEREGGDPS